MRRSFVSLRTAAQFDAVAQGRGALRWRGARQWLALHALGSAAADQAPLPGGLTLRLGLIAPKRWARRAVDRNLVKRVAREALHAAAPGLAQAARASSLTALDVVFRLKSAVPKVQVLSHTSWAQSLRSEADSLLAGLALALGKTVQP